MKADRKNIKYRARVARDKLRLYIGPSPLGRDMDYVLSVLLDMGQEIRKLKIKAPEKPRSFCRPPFISLDPVVTALQIAESAAEGPVCVFRRAKHIGWVDASKCPPAGADVIGTYDHGADWRRIAEDLAA